MTSGTDVQLDPITGLPVDLVPANFQQIPLDSRPSLAPQWSPRGTPEPPLWPDNQPSVFATLQAQNTDSPQTVNALRTHTGTQALEVYTVNSSGGGSSPSAYAGNTSTGHDVAPGGSSFLGQFAAPTAIYQVTWGITYASGAGFPGVGPAYLNIVNATTLTGIPIGLIEFFMQSATAVDGLVQTQEIVFNPPFSASLSGIVDGSGNIGFSATNTSGVHITVDVFCIHS